MAIQIRSDAFEANQAIPRKHARVGGDATLPPGLSKDELMDAAAGHVRDEGDLVGTYQTTA